MRKFNKNTYLEKLRIKKFWQKNARYFYIGIPCFLCSILGIYFAYSKFFVKQEVEVVKTTIGEFTNGDIVLNIYVDNEKVEEAPKKVLVMNLIKFLVIMRLKARGIVVHGGC